jgi:hypothetical protein
MMGRKKLGVEDEGAKSQFPDSQFYFRISEPVVYRRSLLEASKAALGAIKGIHELSHLRPRRQGKLDLLMNEVRQIRLLIQKAEELLPKYSKAEASKRFPHLFSAYKAENPGKEGRQKAGVAEKKSKKSKAEPSVQKKLSEGEMIDKSMGLIEDKLKRLPSKKDAPKHEGKVEEKPKSTAEELSFELGKTLESIQKKLKEL